MNAMDRTSTGAGDARKQPECREQRLQRIRQLIASQGENAARVLQMWMRRDGAGTDHRQRRS